MKKRGYIMKFVRIYISAGLLWCSTVDAMEVPKRFEFLKSSLEDIYSFVEDLSKTMDEEYRILSSNQFVKYTTILGLKPTNTLLDIAFHYYLLKSRLSKKEPAYDRVATAYKNLMQMFLEIDTSEFQKEIQELIYMSYPEIEVLECEGIDFIGQLSFLKEKSNFIRRKIKSLRKYVQKQEEQAEKNIQNQPKNDIQFLLGLPEDASPELIKTAYINFIEQNSVKANKWVAQQRMRRISHQTLKERMAEIEEIKKAYNQYLQQKKEM